MGCVSSYRLGPRLYAMLHCPLKGARKMCPIIQKQIGAYVDGVGKLATADKASPLRGE